jgi:hypothetical protein
MGESILLAIDEDYLEAGLLPSPDTAILLTEACFHCMHDGFWFMDRNAFLQNLSHVLRVRSVHSWAERRWLAMANVVWAIGAKWLQMPKLDKYVETHLAYYARTLLEPLVWTIECSPAIQTSIVLRLWVY